MTAGSEPGFAVALVLGGARSGKTRHALSLAESLHRYQGFRPIYIATAQAHDDEMADRIAHHQAERGPEWRTLEAPLDLSAAVAATDEPGTVLLIDCLTLWLSNVMHAGRAVEDVTDELAAAFGAASGPIVVVSNEVGLSIVPENALARRFRDAQGRLNQTIAAAADRVDFVAAGLPLRLKG